MYSYSNIYMKCKSRYRQSHNFDFYYSEIVHKGSSCLQEFSKILDIEQIWGDFATVLLHLLSIQKNQLHHADQTADLFFVQLILIISPQSSLLLFLLPLHPSPYLYLFHQYTFFFKCTGKYTCKQVLLSSMYTSNATRLPTLE